MPCSVKWSGSPGTGVSEGSRSPERAALPYRATSRCSVVLDGGPEPPRDAEHGRFRAQRLAHLLQRRDHGADAVRVHLVAGARVRLGQHGEEVAGVVPAQIAVGLAVQSLPAAGCHRTPGGQARVGAEDLHQPVDGVAAGVVEHQLPFRGEQALAQFHLAEEKGCRAQHAGGAGGAGTAADARAAAVPASGGAAAAAIADCRRVRREKGCAMVRLHGATDRGDGSICRTLCERSTGR
jgi:hypothetical protein